MASIVDKLPFLIRHNCRINGNNRSIIKLNIFMKYARIELMSSELSEISLIPKI